MILVNNRNILRHRNRKLLNHLSEIELNKGESKVIIEYAKSGVPTLKINLEDKIQYMHSKYDPVREAEQLMKKYEGIDSTKHILFVGSGLGFHIKRFTELNPHAKFSIYEPDEEVLVNYLANKELSDLPLNNLGKIFTGTEDIKLLQEVTALLKESNNMLRIYTLPIYEKIYGTQLTVIMQKALEALKEKRSSIGINLAFQKRWTINSIKNFPTVLKTPNILHDVHKSAFAGKPAIIVAAGPSLNEEFGNLRHIKENGLAYIFSVGSAINSLIKHGIYPDAACTYDPSERNQLVMENIKDKGLSNIPLIFGSSVGFETLEEYPGKMLHMITSQDTVSPQLLNTTQSIDIVLDAPSIAVITLQILMKMGSNPIILVGQNLGFLDNKRYASGIRYESVVNELSEKEKKETFTIKDVNGNDIKTNDGYNRMRQQLEMYIETNKDIDVINTTIGGAHIEGTSFENLKDLIKDKLIAKTVAKGWTDSVNTYNIDYTEQKLQQITRAEKKCKNILLKSLDELQNIQIATEKKQLKSIEKHFSEFDKQFIKLKRNSFYVGFIEPMIRVQHEFLSEEIQQVRYEKDVIKKAEVVLRSFQAFLNEIRIHHEAILPYFEEMKSQII